MNTPLVASTMRSTGPVARSGFRREIPIRAHALRAPVILAPMYLVSGPELVVASCRAGLVGSFPTRNAHTRHELENWLRQITAELDGAPWAVSMIAHPSYDRLDDDLALLAEYRPPLVITALGSPRRAVEVVRGYGGAVFADVSSVEHALWAVEAGADGLVLAGDGALSPLAFVDEVRAFFGGPLVVGGGITTGRGVRAVEVLGAEFALLGARFAGCAEARGDREPLAAPEEIGAIAALHGVPSSWLAESLGVAPERGQAVADVARQVLAEYRAAVVGENAGTAGENAAAVAGENAAAVAGENAAAAGCENAAGAG